MAWIGSACRCFHDSYDTMLKQGIFGIIRIPKNVFEILLYSKFTISLTSNQLVLNLHCDSMQILPVKILW